MKLHYAVDSLQKRIRIKTFSNSTSKQNKSVPPKTFQIMQKNPLQKLKIARKNLRIQDHSQSPLQKPNFQRRLSINSKKGILKTKNNLLMVENFKKPDQQSSRTLSNQPSLSKRSEKSSGIINLLMDKKLNTSVYEGLQNKSGFINGSNYNLVNTHLILENETEPIQQMPIKSFVFQQKIQTQISIFPKPLSIHFQFGFGTNENKKPFKKEASTQTFYQGIQDEFFFDEYLKYKTNKEKYQSLMLAKKQKIEQMINEHTKFEKDHKNLINSVNEPPSDDREKRVLSLAKELDEKEKKVNEKFERLYKMGDEMAEITQKKSKSYFDKKSQLLISISNLSKAIGLKLEEERSENPRINSSERIVERILSQIKYLGRIDTQNRKIVGEIHKLYHEQASDFHEFFKEWRDVLYENRVLLFNFMKQIQKVPLMMTDIFGFGQITEKHQILALENCPKPSQNLLQCCQDCYTFKNNVKYLQLHNNQLRPIFKTIEWLIRDGDKKRECIELI